ncbi:MAG: DUF305 domain-containing protein [Mycobacteriales bacterium]
MAADSATGTQNAEDRRNDAAPDLRRRVAIIALASVAVLIVAAVGLGVGLTIGTPNYPDNASAEAGFARDMSTHHNQAVTMGMLEYRNGGEAGLRSIAYDIALTQQAQVGMMDAWLDQWGLRKTGTGPRMAWMGGGHHGMLLPDGRMPGMASADELARLRQSSGRDADVLFCRLMITHHLGGIHMAEAVLERSDDDAVRALAQSMKDGQQYEIATLENKLTALGEKA